MPDLIDLAGRKFGRLRVVCRAARDIWTGSSPLWECVCDCGHTHMAWGHHLRAGRTQSCGCLKRELARARALAAPRDEHGYIAARTAP